MDHRPRDTRAYAVGKSGTNLLANIAEHLPLESPENLQDAEAAAARFDVSPFRLWLLFQSVDENGDGFISKSELVRALSSASTTAATQANIINYNNNNIQNNNTQNQNINSPNQQTLLGDTDDDEEEEEEDEDEGLEEFLPLEDIQALEELFDRIVRNEEEEEDKGAVTDNKKSDIIDNEDEDDKTTAHQNYLPKQEKRPPMVGITFPQFCRVIRYLWLQQLLNPELDSNPSFKNRHDLTDNAPKDQQQQPQQQSNYQFECVDYASGYYRQKPIIGNAAIKRTRDFFTAPRHGNARMRWIDVPSGTFCPGLQQQMQQQKRQKDSFRLTILRLAVKYRFHPTSIEDAIDLEYQEPKVNSFEHSLFELGDYNCGTVSWLRHAGKHSGGPDMKQQKQHRKNNNKRQAPTSPTPASSVPPKFPPPPPIPHGGTLLRRSSSGSFQSYNKETIEESTGGGLLSNIPDFVIAEGEDDINVYEGRHYFITIPMFELSRRSKTSLDLYNDAAGLVPFMELEPLIIEVNEATLGIFVASNPDANLVVTCSTKWRPTRIKPLQLRRHPQQQPSKSGGAGTSSAGAGGSSSRSSNKSQNDSNGGIFSFGSKRRRGDSDGGSSDSSDNNYDDMEDDDDFIQSMLQDEKMSLERVKDLLKKRHSIQRHRNSNWLMHAIIDAVVDNLGPISKVYEAQLQQMSTRLFELQHRLSKREVKEMIVMKRDLEWLQHELRPFARVIRHLIDDRSIGAEVTHYLEDVEDNLVRTLEELSSYASECTTLKDEYNAYMDRRMNDILYVLTLVTTLVVPAQFFTGYYGMNFENPSTGELGDPLLRQGGAGVGFFWLITFCSTAIVVCFMHRYNFFEKELD